MDKDSTVVLFDGVCHLCDGAVRFILNREKSKDLYFALLQSEIGKDLLLKNGYPESYLDGLVLIENNRPYDRSSACLRIAGKLKFPWNLFFLCLVIPKPIRDSIYSIIARYRYRFFGKKEVCSMPSTGDGQRFL
jgi:predicted DCC family thiol-disulfide oxidoreductase YuxK